MATVKRTKAERESDLALLADRYLSGHTLNAIADEICQGRPYSLSPQTIHYDLKTLRKRWLESSIRDFDHARSEELAKVDKLELTYWQAWERSIKSKQSTVTSKKEGQYAETSGSIKTEQRDGEPRFLAGVMTCIDKRCKLLGLDAPQRHEVAVPIDQAVKALASMSDDDLAQVEKQLRKQGK